MIGVLREKPQWFQSKDGKALFRILRENIRGSAWEEAVYPPPPDAEFKEFDQRLDEAWSTMAEINNTGINRWEEDR